MLVFLNMGGGTEMQIAMKMKVPATVKKKGKFYVSCCPILDVCSQGETKKKALDNLVEALSLFFKSCLERGTLDEVLKESGFVPVRTGIMGKRVAKKPFPSRFESLDIPIPFQIIHKKDEHHQCPA